MSGRGTRLSVLFAATLLCANGQWLNYPAQGTPRSPDGKPNLSARAPRVNGKPDLSGVWETQSAPPGENERLFDADLNALGDDPRNFSKYFFNILVDFKAGESPLRPDAAEWSRKQQEARREAGQGRLCLPMGLPHAELFNYSPFKIVQTTGLIVVLYEMDNTHRQIYTDGRKLPVDPQPSWLGYSIGRWEGDTLVVDTAGFNDKSSLDLMGHPHSEDLRIQERFHRRDFGHLDLSVTIEDPRVYTRPFTIKVTELLIPDSDILESICSEDEKDLTHMPKR